MTVLKHKTPLPEKLSDLILVALEDEAKAHRSEHYRVDMGLWHSPSRYGPCLVCFAGAVMAFTMGTNRMKDAGPGDGMALEDKQRLRALDDIRRGNIRDALSWLKPYHDVSRIYRQSSELPPSISVHTYEKNRPAFREDMREIAKLLKAADQ